MSNFITTDRLNLRAAPSISKDNVIAVMPLATIVESIGDILPDNWQKVKTILSNIIKEGYCASQYLESTTETLPGITVSPNLPEAELTVKPGTVISRNGTGRAYHLAEPGLVKIDLSTIPTTAEKIMGIYSVLDFLNVENSLRYAPKLTATYCNIYAYDFVYCLSRYIPRVWWHERYLEKLIAGEAIVPVPDKTVYELNANALADWFEEFGASFKWSRVWDLTALQDQVNEGRIGIIVAQRLNLNASGHIVAVIPENGTNVAQRTQTGEVILPLQSQSGRHNRKIFTGSKWWANPAQYGKFGFWVSTE